MLESLKLAKKWLCILILVFPLITLYREKSEDTQEEHEKVKDMNIKYFYIGHFLRI